MEDNERWLILKVNDNRWEGIISIDHYWVNVTIEYKNDTYFAEADTFFLVASAGSSIYESIQRIRKLFEAMRSDIIRKLLNN